MKAYVKISLMVICLCSVNVYSDTFKHKESGEVFHGFATQKVTGGKTLVYNDNESKMQPVVLSDYEITPNGQGRRNMVSLLLFNQSEILLSEAVSKQVAKAIVDASDKGPQAIILQIDNPGGRGDSMKTIADAILKTTNCPVIAYISEGAYSAAAVIAFACDRIYLKSTAEIGAVGSLTDKTMGGENFAEQLSIYSPESLLAYSTFVTALAQRNNRPELLAKALIDKRISIVEVVNSDGSRAFIAAEDRQPTQTLTRTLCEGISATASDTVSQADIIGKVLTLSAKDAVELGIAKGYADSIAEVLADLQVSEANITPVPGIQNAIKKYIAARRNITENLYRIEQYERDVETLSEQFSTIDNQLRTGTQTREVSRREPGYISNRRREELPLNYDDRYEDEVTRNGRRRRTDRDRTLRSQRITTEEPRVNIAIVYDQLVAALQEVLAEYNRVLKLAERWPGALPPKVTQTMLENNRNSASAELDRLYRYEPVYPDQTRPETPRTERNERRRY